MSLQSPTAFPQVVADYFNRDKALLPGWFVLRSIDQELACDIAEYDVGTYMRFRLDHKFLYVVFRRHDPRLAPSASPSDDDLVSIESHDSNNSLLKLQQHFDEQSESASPQHVRRRNAMRWTANDLDNLRSGVTKFGKDWQAILDNFDFRGRNMRVGLTPAHAIIVVVPAF